MSCRIAWFLAASQLALACAQAPSDGASVEVAEVALQQSALTAQLGTLVADAADMSSHFDIGQGLETAAQQLEAHMHEQMPCATITRQGSALSIVYGAGDTACDYHGHSLSGQHMVRVTRSADNEVAVHHEWQDFGDERLSLSGSADVTWSRTSGSRRVVHAVTFHVLDGADAGDSGDSTGDSTQTPLDGGVRINGLRQWSSQHGHYELDMEAVEQRFADSVPQSGAYELTTPTDNALTLAFGRVDADNIRVTIQGAQKALSFVVRADGRVVP